MLQDTSESATHRREARVMSNGEELLAERKAGDAHRKTVSKRLVDVSDPAVACWLAVYYSVSGFPCIS
jgi:hypothetical protein